MTTTNDDAELNAIEQLISALDPLDQDARNRVIAYVSEFECACRVCGQPAEASPNDPEGWRCPACGYRQRRISLRVHERLSLREVVRGKVKTSGVKRPRIEFVEGDDLHRDSGRWMKLSRQIDRGNDRYRERVVDPETGAVVHECDESLSDHTGHGSAKRGE